MAAKKPVFHVLEDLTGKDGASWPARQAGDASASVNAASVLTSIDSTGALQYVKQRTAGQAGASVSSLPTLPAVDLAGNLQPLSLRDEGAVASGVDSVPVLPAKNAAGNLVYIPVNADGEVVVSNSPNGTPKYAANAAAVAGSIGTFVDVVTLALTASKVYEDIEFMPVSSFFTEWQLVQIDDATTTIKARAATGAGDHGMPVMIKNLLITAGATGTQSLKLQGKQIQGTSDDLNGHVGAFEKA